MGDCLKCPKTISFWGTAQYSGFQELQAHSFQTTGEMCPYFQYVVNLHSGKTDMLYSFNLLHQFSSATWHQCKSLEMLSLTRLTSLRYGQLLSRDHEEGGKFLNCQSCSHSVVSLYSCWNLQKQMVLKLCILVFLR